MIASDRYLWIKSHVGCRDVACPASIRKLVILIPFSGLEGVDLGNLLRKWSGRTSDALLLCVESEGSSRSVDIADEKAEFARVKRIRSQQAFLESELGIALEVRELRIEYFNSHRSRKSLVQEIRSEIYSTVAVVAPSWTGEPSGPRSMGLIAKMLAEEIGCELHFYPMDLPPFAMESFCDGVETMARRAIEFKRAIDTGIPGIFRMNCRKLTFEALVN